MAAIDQPSPKAGKKPRARKHNFRLDMTPMVDLAFLLLTFFMLTTTFAKPRVMQLTMPVKSVEETPLQASKALTIVLGSGHQVFYYFGLNAPADPSVPVPTLHRTDFGPRGLRQALLARGRQQPTPVILIKTAPRAKYQDMVNALDEMNITDQKQYAVTALSAADRQLLPAAER
jgi:biopolymer transport protein ExbD